MTVILDVMQPIDRIDDPVKLRQLVQSLMLLDGELSLPVVLQRLLEEACTLVGARYGALGILNETRTGLDHFLTVGIDDEVEQAIGPRPTGRGILGTLIESANPLRLSNIAESPESFGFPEHHPAMTSFLGVPIRVRGEVFGNLYLTNKEDGAEFSEDDEAAITALALAAGIAIQNARVHTVLRERTLTEDRDRIARDLHDSIIQRLFAIGLSLQGTGRLIDRPEVAKRIADAINNIDETIRQLRTAIFDLETTLNREGLRRKVYDLLLELTPTLGIQPQVTFSGLIETAVSSAIADHLIATLREALTNVAKHARASSVVITIAAGDELRLVVADDGRGMSGGGGEGLGLKNMRTRAERLGGNLYLGTSREGGTRLTWTIPLPLPEEEVQSQSDSE